MFGVLALLAERSSSALRLGAIIGAKLLLVGFVAWRRDRRYYRENGYKVFGGRGWPWEWRR